MGIKSKVPDYQSLTVENKGPDPEGRRVEVYSCSKEGEMRRCDMDSNYDLMCRSSDMQGTENQ